MTQPIIFTIKGIPELKEMLKRKDKLAMQKAQEALRRIGTYMADQTKTSISQGINAPVAVDTGQFRDSVKWEVDSFTAIIYSDVHHAQFVEYGTSRMEPRPHFRNTLFREKPQIEDFMKNKIKEIEGA